MKRFYLILLLAYWNLSAKPLDQLCKRKDAVACMEFGVKTKIPLYLQRSCDLNLGQGCMEWALRLFKEKKGVDGENALKKGCRLSDGDSCSYLGALLHKRGEFENARVIYSKACQLKSGKGCYNLAILNETNGDEAAAQEFFFKACEGDIAQGCVNYAYFIEKNDSKLALNYYKKACDLKSRLGCQKFTP